MQKTKVNPVKNPNENRNFALIMTAGLLLFGAGLPLFKKHSINTPIVVLALLFLAIGLIRPALLEKPRVYWIWLGEKLGYINSRIMFSVLYMILFSFVHLVFIVTGRDKMQKRWKKYSTTYKIKNNISSFRDPF